MSLSQNTKGICTIISVILNGLLIGNLFTFSNLSVYNENYLKNHGNPNLKKDDITFLTPIGLFIFNSFPIFVGIIEQYLNCRIIILIGILCLLISNLLMVFTTDFYLIIISMIFYGLVCAFNCFTVLRNCWEYYPNKKGLLSGINTACNSISTFIFTSIGDYIINSDGKGKPDDPNIYNRYPIFLKLLLVCTIVLGSLAVILCFPYEKEEDEKKESLNNNIISENDSLEEKNKIPEENKTEKENNIDGEIKITQILFSFQLFLMCVVGAFVQFFNFFMSNTYRKFGSENGKNEKYLQILSKVFMGINIISRPLWGIIYDKLSFFFPYIILCINEVVCSGLYYISVKKDLSFFLINCFCVLSFSGHFVLFTPLVAKKFGIKYSQIVFGIIGTFNGITALLGPTILKIVDYNYKILYYIGCGLAFISLILVCFIKDEKMKISEIPEKYETIDNEEYIENQNSN